ncbi:MAG: hypothetical protein LAO79_07880 [Acidobacteriia bacterium]|nr:hypothetical protein [Terriglobia bacterium]
MSSTLRLSANPARFDEVCASMRAFRNQSTSAGMAAGSPLDERPHILGQVEFSHRPSLARAGRELFTQTSKLD